MKLRVFLRGLGIALIVIPLIYTIAPDAAGRQMTDEQIKARAKSLGMVEEDKRLISYGSADAGGQSADDDNGLSSDIVEHDEGELPEDAAVSEDNETSADDDKDSSSDVTEPDEGELPEDAASEEDNESSGPANTAPVSGTYSLTIAGGSSSDQVARLLEKGGVIDSAADFDSYLCSNRYDHRIVPGTHSIPAGADYKSIAEIITSR